MLSLRSYGMVMILAAMMLSQNILAVGDSRIVQVLESGKKTKRLEGAGIKMARPILKMTPMVAVLDEIDMMIYCPVDKNSKNDNGQYVGQIEETLKDYMLVKEIDDELSHMLIYIHGLQDDRFSELILYITSPNRTLLFFKGDFTVESLMEVGELSEQDRKRRIKDKKEKGKDDSYLQFL